jgi:hypothetical protein
VRRFKVTHNFNGTVDLELGGITVLELVPADAERGDDRVTLGMSVDDFEFLTGRMVRAELERDLNDARRRIEQLTEERDRMTVQRDAAVRRVAVTDMLRPIRIAVSAELLTGSAEKELRAVIVSQAREITRLKGESQ